MFNPLAKMMRSKRGVGITLTIWLAIVLLLSIFAPSANDKVATLEGSGLPEEALSEQANKEMDQYFREDELTPAILVFTSENTLSEQELTSIATLTQTLVEKPIKYVNEVLPLYQFPPQVLQTFLSEDGSSISIPVGLQADLESKQIEKTLEEIKTVVNNTVEDSVTYHVTGPAAIASDATKLFERADIVLLVGTVLLILVLLIVIYRSPLLAIIPLLACGIVYQVVIKVFGIAGDNGLFFDQQTLSIMLILLFAAITDYSLFVFARFREELQTGTNKYESMSNAMKHVGEPIFFSGATVIVSVLMLFFAQDAAYRNFAPVFSIAMLIIVIGGLTLVPALFTLFGKIAFWPFIPKINQESKKRKSNVWFKLGSFVTKRPIIVTTIVTLVMVAFSLNVFNIQYSFNILKSFPEDMESRVGFEVLEEKYSPGSLAPTSVLITSDEKIESAAVSTVIAELEKQDGVESLSPSSEEINNLLPTVVSENGKAVKLEMILADDPYSLEAINTIKTLQEKSDEILKNSDTDNAFALYYAGETALQADIDRYNDRDTTLVVILVTLFITIMLGILTRSLVAPIYMMGTILLSFFSALGLGIFLLDTLFGIEAMSSRIPLYTFVFLVALGVDYNIMLVSRIQEELGHYSIKEAVKRGVGFTGGVISSAGLILAATFAVLTTQPIMELFIFGFIVALGVIIDTFIVRSMLVPAIIVILGKRSFWPYKKSSVKKNISA